jgi:hypothetical protein
MSGAAEVSRRTSRNRYPTIFGADNLIRIRTANIPSNTMLEFACPHLGPLRDNGGRTATHALMSDSPAIDAGDSLKVSDFDQRGSLVNNGVLDYLRISSRAGDPPLADIGAYEVQRDDVLFTADFEGCPPPPV